MKDIMPEEEFKEVWIMSKKVLRMTFPEWQGGANPNYYFGSKLLTQLAPQEGDYESVEVPVETNFDDGLTEEDGITAMSSLLRQQKDAIRILEEKKPDKIITFGGACSVEQAPIDYLHGLYPDAGLIWIDVHPDISQPGDYPNEHAMVLGNLLGHGAKDFAALVRHPFDVKDVMYAGMKAESMETYEKAHMAEYKIACAGPEELRESSQPVIDWIKKNGYSKMIVHWDLDVLSPADFRSLLVNEPHENPGFVAGDMRIEEVTRLIKDISEAAEIVGLGITEFLPWDEIRLRKAMEQIDIFR